MLSRQQRLDAGLSPLTSVPEPYSLFYPLDLTDLPHAKTFEVDFSYRSVVPWTYPHRLQLHGSFLAGRRLKLGDRVRMRVANVPTWHRISDPDGYIIEGWVVGYHYVYTEVVELVVLGKFKGELQLVFLAVHRTQLDFDHGVPFSFSRDGNKFWTYLTTADIGARARAVLGAGENVESWGPRYPAVERMLVDLRSAPVGRLLLHDPHPTCLVRRLELIPIQVSDFLATSGFLRFLRPLCFVTMKGNHQSVVRQRGS